MNERDLERSEARVEREREQVAKQATQKVHERGAIDCIECGDPISEERRQAAPFAKRCIECQQETENRSRTHAV